MRQRPFFLLTLLLSALAPAAAQAATAQGWLLNQYTPYSGQHQLFFSSDGLRIATRKMGITVVSKAPDWTITMFNDRSKTFYQTSYQDWTRRHKRPGHSKFGNKPPRKGTTSNIAGLSATQYIQGTQGQPGSIVYWLSNDITVPKQLSSIITSQFNLPSVTGMPLRVDQVDDHGRPVTALNTESAHTQHLTAANFRYPSAYKRVQDDMEVLVPNESSQSTQDLLNELSNDPASQKELKELLNTGTKSAPKGKTYQASAPTHAKPAAKPAANPYHSPGQKSPSANEINSLIDSFLKSK